MRCLMCAAEMYVTQVAQDGTISVPGFEHHTLECLECGDIERRLVFTREKTQPISPSLRRKKERIVKPRTPMEAFEGEMQLSFPKIQSGGIRAVRQNQRIIRCDVCDHPPACNVYSRSVQVATPA
jgi:hypothetical protein